MLVVNYIITDIFPLTRQMARRGKQRSPQQRQHTREMGRQRLALGSPSLGNIIEPVDPRAASKKHKKDAKEANAQHRLARNAHKREERLKEKVDKQTKVITYPMRFGVGG